MGPLRERIERLGSRDLGRAADVVAIVVSAFLTVAASDGPSAWSPFPRPVAIAAGLAGTAALWWRRSHPTTVAAVNVAAVAFSANGVPAAVALYTAATLVGSAFTLAALVVAGSVALAVPEWVDDGHVGARPLVASTLTVLAIVGLGLYTRTRRDLLGSLRARAEGAEAERELRAEQARAGERARIAREMHDVLAHKVSLIALHAGALEVNPGVGPERVEEAAGLIRQTAVQALEELRSVLGVLREGAGPDDALAPSPQAVDIARLVESSRAAGVDATLRPDVPDLPAGLARTAYRVVQEALTNVHKHAPGAAAAVELTGGEADGLTITVDNDPPPRAVGDALPGSGAGLVGLRERLRLAGGRLTSGPTPGGGWRLVAWVPWTGGGLDAAERVGEGERGDVIRVLIVDDEALIRAGMRMILESADDLEVVGEADDGAEAAAAARRCRPDVVLMDVRMPRLDGIAATRAVRALDPAPAVIVLTTFDLDDHVFGALQAGAAGFLLKDTPPRELVQAVRVVAQGASMLSPTVTRRLIAHFAADGRGDRRQAARARLATLSARESEVLAALGRGLSNAEIGATLYMSEATAKAHVSRLLVKVGATNRVQLAIVAHEAGLTD